VAHLVAHRLGEHVAVVGPVQRQCADRPVLGVEDRLVTHRQRSLSSGACKMSGGTGKVRTCPTRRRGMIQELLPQAERIAAVLKARGETVSVAESSTAGLISAALLAVGGASAYFMGGAV